MFGFGLPDCLAVAMVELVGIGGFVVVVLEVAFGLRLVILAKKFLRVGSYLGTCPAFYVHLYFFPILSIES